VQHELTKSTSWVGLVVAAIVIAIWLGSLVFFAVVDIDLLTPAWLVPAILGRIFIHTGLFIVAHDAIHGAVYPLNASWNHAIGRLAVTLYAFLDYQKLSLNHWQHHRHPGCIDDPDFHHGNGFVWYFHFMKGYLNVKQTVIQLLGLGSCLAILYFGLHASLLNLALFWVIPIFLSTIQLFFFGTYLPHRSREGGSVAASNGENYHSATSSNFPPLISFFTCYHFGYHWEHHEYPTLPWYALPGSRQLALPKPPPIVAPDIHTSSINAVTTASEIKNHGRDT
jgi:beta-carotene/zeaxanthin 4-ketolase